MKNLLLYGLVLLLIFSCKKRNHYIHFNEKQLEFVNYSDGQIIKFIDTTLQVQTLEQQEYSRYFHEQIGIIGRTGNFTEEYEVSYRSKQNFGLGLQISVSAFASSLDLEIDSYWNYPDVTLDSLQPTFPTLTVNGQAYSNVYTQKMYKDAQYINNADTATVFLNGRYGVIQLVFPDGKKIVRID